MNGNRLTDKELAHALKQGDETAFEDLFERHSRTLVAYMRRYLRLSASEADDLADDLVQGRLP